MLDGVVHVYRVLTESSDTVRQVGITQTTDSGVVHMCTTCEKPFRHNQWIVYEMTPDKPQTFRFFHKRIGECHK